MNRAWIDRGGPRWCSLHVLLDPIQTARLEFFIDGKRLWCRSGSLDVRHRKGSPRIQAVCIPQKINLKSSSLFIGGWTYAPLLMATDTMAFPFLTCELGCLLKHQDDFIQLADPLVSQPQTTSSLVQTLHYPPASSLRLLFDILS